MKNRSVLTTLTKLQQRGDDAISDHPPQKHLFLLTNEFDDAPCLIILTYKCLFHNYSEELTRYLPMMNLPPTPAPPRLQMTDGACSSAFCSKMAAELRCGAAAPPTERRGTAAPLHPQGLLTNIY